MTEAEMRQIALGFPGVTEGKSYGAPAFVVNKKFFTRLRRDDASMVLMEAEPATFHITAHYKDYPAVLARIATLHPGSYRNFLERRWRKIAPKTLVKAYEKEQAG